MVCSPSDPSVHGIVQAKILEWVANFFSRDLPDSGIAPMSSAFVGRLYHRAPREAPSVISWFINHSVDHPQKEIVLNKEMNNVVGVLWQQYHDKIH